MPSASQHGASEDEQDSGLDAAGPPRRRRMAVLAAVAAFVLAADLLTKAIVVAHLRPDQPVHLIGNVLTLWLTRSASAPARRSSSP